MARIAIACALAMVGCASTRPRHPVQSVKVEGNKAFGDKDIVSRLATRPPQGLIIKTSEEFDPVALQLDRRRVEAFYHERGYFDAHVENIDVQQEPKGGVRVTIDVVEGQPTQVAAIEVDGVKSDFARGVLKKKAPDLEEGKRLDHPAYLLAKDALQQALVKSGYAHAKVDGVVEVDRPAHRAVVRLYADPGPLVHFGKVKVEGLTTIPESAVRARIAFTEGDVFDPEALDATEGRLYALGFFGSVRADWEREGRPPVTDVTIKVTEGLRHELRLGFGAGVDRSRWELRTRGGYVIRGVLGPLTTLRLDARPGYSWLRGANASSGPSIDASVTLERADFLMPRVDGRAIASYQREPREGYILAGPRLNLSLGRPLFGQDAFNVYAGWEIRYLDFIDADPMVFGADALSRRLAYFEQRAIFDDRDVPLDARKGYYGEINVDEGGPFAGGEKTFIKARGEARAFLPLLDRLTLAGRLAGGRLTALAGGETSPLPVRFYGGGGTDHRGFGFRRLSPMRRDSAGRAIPIGGDDMLLASAETRIDLFKIKKQWLSMAVFVDAGDVTAPPASIDLGNLHYAAGFGFRYDTLIGPVRADLGVRLNRVDPAGPDGLANPDPGQRFAFHLSLGEAF